MTLRVTRSVIPRRAITAATVLALSVFTPLAEAQDRSGGAAFLQWASRTKIVLATPLSASDVAALKNIIGDARVVALSEPAHFAAEPLEFRNRLIESLVRELGFTAVALESGLTESRAVYDFVLGGRGDLDSVVRQGFSWTFDQLPQNAGLVKWLRTYNASRPNSQRVRLYGIDVPGSPGNPYASHGPRTGLEAALTFLKGVAPDEGRTFEARLAPFWDFVRFDLRPDNASLRQYRDLTQNRRDALTAAITDLISLFEREEVVYSTRTSARKYQWAYRSALGARAVDSWLREIPVGWRPSPGRPWWQSDWVDVAREVRDHAMAETLEWVLAEEEDRARVLVFAHRFHVASAPVLMYSSSPAPSLHPRPRSVLGYYLRQRLGPKLVTIGTLVGGGVVGCGSDRLEIGRSPVPSLDELVGNLKVPLMLLHLRDAPQEVRSWLDEEHDLWDGDDILRVRPGTAFDALLYFAKVSPACP
jgi:erythromycin esterase